MIDRAIDEEELEIRQMFLEEAQEYVDTMDDGLIGIDPQSSTFKHQMDMILRAAHSLKGAAGIMQFHELSETAHRFEDSLKIIKSNHPEIDINSERLLLNAVGLLREIILINRQGKDVSQVWLEKFDRQIFIPLETYLSNAESHAIEDIPEAEIDIAAMMFEQEINEMLTNLEAKLAITDFDNVPNLVDLKGELQNLASELADLGEMLELPNFIELNRSIAQKTEEVSPEKISELAVSALKAWRRSQALVIEGNKADISSEFDFNQGNRATDNLISLDLTSEDFAEFIAIDLELDLELDRESEREFEQDLQNLDDLTSFNENYKESISIDDELELDDLFANYEEVESSGDRIELDGLISLDENYEESVSLDDELELDDLILTEQSYEDNEQSISAGDRIELDDLNNLISLDENYENFERSTLPKREDLDSLFELLADRQINPVINQLPLELTDENLSPSLAEPFDDSEFEDSDEDLDNPFIEFVESTAIADVLEEFNPFDDFIDDTINDMDDEELKNEDLDNPQTDIFSSNELLLETTPIDKSSDQSFEITEISNAFVKSGEPDTTDFDTNDSDGLRQFSSIQNNPLSNEDLLGELFDTLIQEDFIQENFIQENYGEDNQEVSLDRSSSQPSDREDIDDLFDLFIDISIPPLVQVEISTIETLDPISNPIADELLSGDFNSNLDSLQQESQDTLTDLFENFFNSSTTQSTSQSTYIPKISATKTLGMDTANDLFDSFFDDRGEDIGDTVPLFSMDMDEISSIQTLDQISEQNLDRALEKEINDDLFADFLGITDLNSESLKFEMSDTTISTIRTISTKEDVFRSGSGGNLSQYIRESSQPHAELSLPDTLDDLQEDLELSGDVPESIPDRVSDLVTTYVKDTSIRIPVSRLEQLHDLSGEMIFGHNSLDGQIKQLRQLLKSLHSRIRTLENANSQLAVIYDRMTTEASTNNFIDNSIEVNKAEYAADFDSLELDSYSELHSLSQSVSEAIVQLQEVVEDVDLSLNETEQNANSLNTNFRQLQSAIKETKMRPLRDIVGRFPRVIRSLGLQYDKSVEVVLNGVDLLIEQTILDVINDPLNHLLRNAFDHGIEDRSMREQSRKNSQAKIEITAKQIDSKILITVSDNGGGIDPRKIEAKALRSLKALGLTQAQVESMDDEQLIQLIFEPEFTTTDKVTSLSGRGVGMDVVKTNLKQIGAEIYTQTELGVGTTFTVSIPSTLTALRITLIEVNHTIVGIPTDWIQAVIPDIDYNHDRIPSTIRYQNSDIPLFPLDKHLQINCDRRDRHLEDKPASATKSILVINFEQKAWGIYVNGCWDEQEVTLRQPMGGMPLPKMFTGCAIVASGQSVPILDMQVLKQNPINISFDLFDLFDRTNDNTNSNTSANPTLNSFPNPTSNFKSKQKPTQNSILVVDDSVNVRRYLALVLKKAGFKVDQAKDGEEAIAKLIANLEEDLQVDVVLSDVEMPQLDGYGLLARIKSEPKLQDLPVVMLTSRSGDKHRDLAISLGASDYFTKPFAEDDLIQCLKRLASNVLP